MCILRDDAVSKVPAIKVMRGKWMADAMFLFFFEKQKVNIILPRRGVVSQTPSTSELDQGQEHAWFARPMHAASMLG
jgi:hypothetical protein